jgi:hypothetical protein
LCWLPENGMYAGSDGQFTISFWFKANSSAQKGDLFEYIFSHSANATRQHYSTVDTFQPNQVHMFLPEQGHPAHGLLRSVVKVFSAFECFIIAALFGRACPSLQIYVICQFLCNVNKSCHKERAKSLTYLCVDQCRIPLHAHCLRFWTLMDGSMIMESDQAMLLHRRNH